VTSTPRLSDRERIEQSYRHGLWELPRLLVDDILKLSGGSYAAVEMAREYYSREWTPTPPQP
jgi:hypothetical protein